jgi:hypothetical protein
MNLEFVITNDSKIIWNWNTEHWLEVTTSGNGSVDVGNGWHAVGSQVTLIATAAANHHFTGWIGDAGAIVTGDPTSMQITVRLDAPVTLTAGFAIDTYTVSYLPGDHGTITSGDPVQTIGHGGAAVAPTITADAWWTFTGWDNTAFDNVTGPLTVTAQYVQVTPLQAYQAWTTLAGLTNDNALPGAIPYGDGVANLIKYAFNMNGAGSDAHTLVRGSSISGLPCLSADDSAGVFRYEFVRRKSSGLVYAPKQSTTLEQGAWVPMTGTTKVTDIDAEWERVVIEQSYDPGVTPACFFTVEVALP